MSVEKYRNIFFKKDILQNGTGTVIVYYTGNMYGNSDKIKDFSKKFDRTKDLLISCNDCANRKYKKFVKVDE